MKTLYTGGTMDLYHAGHANFLRQCRGLADRVVVSLNTDEFIKEYKGKPPIMSYGERKEVLLSCRYVDEVIPNIAGKDSKPAILSVKPHIVAVGSDWAKRDYFAQMDFSRRWLDDHDIILVYIEYTDGISTTELKKRILGS